MSQPTVEAFFDPVTFTVSYLVYCIETKEAAIIDPVLDFDYAAGRTGTQSADAVLARTKALGLTLRYILETHAHADHITGAQYLHAATGGMVGIGTHIKKVQKTFARIFNIEDGMATDGSQFDLLLEGGDTLVLGTFDITVMGTPGHTPACVSYLIGDAAFVGDTLFMPDFGTARCDFPGGSAAVLYQSIQRLLSLDADTRIFVGHDYGPGGRDFAWQSSVAQQKADNIHVGGGASEADFIAMREARDRELAMPKLILPAIQLNIRAGKLPIEEDNGTSYLKIPIDAL